jgi:uncharacterized protein (TIGR00290 family)
MNKPDTAYMNWSGGKDSSLCLHHILQEGRHEVNCLLTNVNAHHNRISMHGVRRELLEAQAAATGLPLETVELPEQPGMREYEEAMNAKVSFLKNKGCTQAIFGDIFLEDLKKYREEKLAALDIECIFPLWKIPTIELMKEFIGLGFKAVIVCVNEKYLDSSFCGRLIDEVFLADLPANVDPCGENGEYHSFVFEGPVFKYPIPFEKGGIVRRQYAAPATGFYFADLLPVP